MKIQKLKSMLTLLLVACVFNVVVAQSGSTTKKKHKTSIKSKGKHHSVGVFNNYKIEYEGEFALSDDDTDIAQISKGGFVDISKTTFGNKRRILIENEGTQLARKYYVGRKETPYEPEGKEWLSEILPEIVRTTGLGARSRVERFYSKGGVSAVLDEIAELEGSYMKAMYTNILLEKDKLTNEDLTTILEVVSMDLYSDYYLASIMKENSRRFLSNDEVATAYIDAIEEIDSDYHAASVIEEVVKDNSLSDQHIAAVIEVASILDSDYYLSQILTKIIKAKTLNDQQIIELINASYEVSSDYYHSQLISELLEDEKLSGASYTELLNAVVEVSSDHYMASTFSKILDDKLDEATLVGVLELVGEDMMSNHYTSTVLGKAIKKQEFTDKSMETFAYALEDMSSDHYATEVVKDASSQTLTDTQLITLINALEEIDSDHYLSTSLIALAPRVKTSGGNVKDAYIAAVEWIDSETYIGRAMKAIQ